MKRPALQQLISDIQSIDKVVVYKLDRLSRNQRDTLILIEDIFVPNNTDLVSLNESFDTSTPFGRFMIGILSSFAQLEKSQISDRMSLGKEARAKDGKWHGGKTPKGYKYVNGDLIVDDYEKMALQEIFDRYSKGEPLRSIETDLKNRGITTSSGYQWTPKTMRYAIANKIYLGYIRHKGEWIQGTHEQIIDSDTFLRANRRLSQAHEEFTASGIKTGIRANTTLLGGLIWCSQCGARYGKAKNGKHDVYKCYSRHKKVKAMIKNPNCKNKIYKIDELDNMILDEIRKLTLEKICDIKGKDNLPVLRERLDSINSQIERYMKLYSLGRYEISDLDKFVLPLEQQKKSLEMEIQRESMQIDADETLNLVESFDDIIEKGTFEEVRTVIEALIDRIEIDGEDISIYWKFKNAI